MCELQQLSVNSILIAFYAYFVIGTTTAS